MNKTKLTWENENDSVIEQLFDSFMEKCALKRSDPETLGVELYLTASCNQKCEYCYLTKHGDLLYPMELRDQTVILNNLKMLLFYFLEKDYNINHFDIFSGEVWSSNFGITVLEYLLEYVKTSKHPPEEISIPSNCSFVLNKEYFEKIKKFIDGFQYYGTRLTFSASIDGPVLEEENRSFHDSEKNKLRDENFYTTIFDFCKEYDYGFHPMVNAYSIEKWPEQYDWWISKLKEYDFDYFSYIMFLEVRNDEWTDEKIQSYLSFLNHAYETVKKEIFDNDLEDFIRSCLNIATNRFGSKITNNYYHLRLAKFSSKMGCTVDREIMIRLGDLAWVPCHRTSYDKFVYGRFKIENNKIIGLQALNLPLLFSIYGTGFKGHPACDVCSIGYVCIRGCYGAQFEAHKELFYPCESVCNLLKAKTLFLYRKILKDVKTLNTKEFDLYLNQLKNMLEKEEFKKWETMVSNALT